MRPARRHGGTGLLRGLSLRAPGVVAATAIAGLVLGSAAAAALPFRVVAHAGLGIERITSTQLAALYLGRPVDLETSVEPTAVDLPVGSPLRQAFSRIVLGRTPEQIDSYWQRRIFEGGGVPPARLETPEEVLGYVARTPGAIAYLPANARPPAGARVVELYFSDLEAVVLDGEPPEYPPMARRARAEGTVRLRVWIDAAGRADEIEILDGGAFGLGDSAKKAMKDWRFDPPLVDDEPVPSVLIVPVDFRL